MSAPAAQLTNRPQGTLSDQVLARLRADIIEGRIPAGSKISEPELARQLGISRGPLREAIGRLEASGLVERKPNVGARIVQLTPEKLIEIYKVREALEGMAAREAARNMSDLEIAELRELLRVHAEDIAEDERQAYFQREGDLDFHYRIVQGSKNGMICQFLCNDLYHLARLYRHQSSMQSRRGPRALREHEHVLDAIEAREPEMAEHLMRAHIRASRKNIEALLREASETAADT